VRAGVWEQRFAVGVVWEGSRWDVSGVRGGGGGGYGGVGGRGVRRLG